METEKQLLGALLDMTAEQQQATAVALSKLERQAQALDAVIQRAHQAAGEMEQANEGQIHRLGVTSMSWMRGPRPSPSALWPWGWAWPPWAP